MSNEATSTRRSFLKGGALLAAPLVAAAAPAVTAARDDLKARLARLEDEAAIRALHRNWLREVNTRAGDATRKMFAEAELALDHAVRGITADHTGAPEAIEVAPDGRSAAGRYECAVEIETAIPKDCTLAQMAYAQGGGFVRRTERRALKVDYVKAAGAWAISKVEFAAI